MSGEFDDLRRDLAAERGLDEAAIPFLHGSTLSEVERSADALATLIASHGTHEQTQTEPLAGLFADAASAKERRKREIVQALHGPQPQPRDEHGRWASSGPPSFDGGARQPVPLAVDPAREHDKLISALANVSRTYRGVTF